MKNFEKVETTCGSVYSNAIFRPEVRFADKKAAKIFFGELAGPYGDLRRLQREFEDTLELVENALNDYASMLGCVDRENVRAIREDLDTLESVAFEKGEKADEARAECVRAFDRALEKLAEKKLFTAVRIASKFSIY